MEFLTSAIVGLFGGNLLPKSAKNRDLRVKSFLQDTLPKIKNDARSAIEKNRVLSSECMELVRGGISVKRMPDPNSWLSKSFRSFRGLSRRFIKRQSPSFQKKVKKKQQTFFRYCVSRAVGLAKAVVLAVVNVRLTIQMSIVRWYLAEKILENYPGLRSNYMTLVGLLAFFTAKMRNCKSRHSQEELVMRMLKMAHILESVMDFLYDEDLGSAEDQSQVIRQISMKIAKMYREAAKERKAEVAADEDSSDDDDGGGAGTADDLARMKASGAASLPAAQGISRAVVPAELQKDLEQTGQDLGKAAASEALKMVGGVPMVGGLVGHVDSAYQEYEGEMQKASDIASQDHEAQIQQQVAGGQFGGVLGALPSSLNPGLEEVGAEGHAGDATSPDASPEKAGGGAELEEGGEKEGGAEADKQEEGNKKDKDLEDKDKKGDESESDSDEEGGENPVADMKSAEVGDADGGEDADMGGADEGGDDGDDASFMEEGATLGMGRRNLTKLLTNWHLTQTISIVLSSSFVLLLTIPLTTTSYLLTFVVSSKLLAAIPCFYAFLQIILLWFDFYRACSEPVFYDKLVLLYRATKSAAKAQEESVSKLLEEKTREF